MPRGMYRSRSLRRVFVKAPGNTVKLHYKKRKPSKAKCGKCKAVLRGVARARPYKMKKMSLSQKRPTRPYGGNLCSACTRSLFKEQARKVSLDV